MQTQIPSESTELTLRLQALESEVKRLRRSSTRWRRGLAAMLLAGAR